MRYLGEVQFSAGPVVTASVWVQSPDDPKTFSVDTESRPSSSLAKHAGTENWGDADLFAVFDCDGWWTGGAP